MPSSEWSFNAWKRMARGHAALVPSPTDDWDWLAIAQHHGLATRMLDWTYNPLVAAYFSAAGTHRRDAIVYAYYTLEMIDQENEKPFKVSGVRLYRPRGVAQRIVRQGGIFTVHGPPQTNLEDVAKKGQLERIVIDAAYRQQLIFELAQYGVHRMSLFPDLDGLSEHVNWYMVNRSYWSSSARLILPPNAGY